MSTGIRCDDDDLRIFEKRSQQQRYPLARHYDGGDGTLLAREGWLYGVWYCGTSFQKADYYGKFPPTFVKRVRDLFPDGRLLHLCCGTAYIDGAVNVDTNPDVKTDYCCDVEKLPKALKANSFDWALIDPPYTPEDASRYKRPRLLSPKRTMAECHRVLRPGGWLLWLDEKYPSYRRVEWRLRGLIAVVTGFERRTRILAMFQKVGENA